MRRNRNHNTDWSPAESLDLPTPGTDLRFEEVFDFPIVKSEGTIDYLNKHGRIMFIVRGQPGTGKNTLASMITSEYPNSELCSADNYYHEPFVSDVKNQKSLKSSHEYCHRKAKQACQENKHPIIIKNSNILKWEMQFYINLAAEYCYTVIMVSTSRKLSATPKVLERTNTQGLKKDYFQKRLKQWEEVVPQYTGWMLSPADTGYIMAESEKCLESLAKLKDFSKVFCTQSGGNPKDFFSPEYFPFCIATFCDSGKNSLTRQYYLSRVVQAVYGKAFPLVIQAFVITKSFVAAIVHLEENKMDLVLEDELNTSDLSDVLGAMSVNCDIKHRQPVTDLIEYSKKTATSCLRCKNDKIDTKNCSFIILSTAVKDSPKYPYIKNIGEFSDGIFSGVTDSDGNISAAECHTLRNSCKYYKLPCDSWLVFSPEKITLQSVFTGLYV